MILTAREFWTAFHGLVLGSFFLLSFSGVLIALYGFRTEWLSPRGLIAKIKILKTGTLTMAAVAWLTVITGTYIIYPWYRAKPPEGANLLDYPRSYLLSVPHLSIWHTFGMEWKEHVAWFSPILATAVAFIVWRFADQISENRNLRNSVAIIFILAFFSAAVAGLFGAFITKAAPIL